MRTGILPFESFVQTCWGERRLLAPGQASVLPGVAGGTEELGGFAGCPEGRSCRGLEGITTLSFAFFGFLTSRPLASRLPILAPSSRKIYCDNRELNERFRQEQAGAELLQPSPSSVAPLNMIIVYSSVGELPSQANSSGNTSGKPRCSRTSCPHTRAHTHAPKCRMPPERIASGHRRLRG